MSRHKGKRVEKVQLDDGRRVRVRPIRPDDIDELRRAIAEADPDTLRQRFLGGRPPETDEELRRLVEVDHVRREAFVALGPHGRGVGIARYEGLADGRSAEVAVAVDPDWRGVGLATALLTRLMRAALRNGITTIRADYYAANSDVDDLMARAGQVSERHLQAGVVEEEVRVNPDAFTTDEMSRDSA